MNILGINELKKSFEFRTIDFKNNNEKITRVKIELNLEYKRKEKINYKTLEKEKSYWILSICGEIWKGNSCISGGQCLDDIVPLLSHNKKFLNIYYYWINYHLNDLQTGTLEQIKALEQKDEKLLWADNYSEACKYLFSISLQDDRGVEYGSSWLLKKIPNNVILEIYKLCRS